MSASWTLFAQGVMTLVPPFVDDLFISAEGIEVLIAYDYSPVECGLDEACAALGRRAQPAAEAWSPRPPPPPPPWSAPPP